MTSSSSAAPPSERSTARLLLLGCAGLIAFCIVAFVVLVVVRAIQLGSAENRGSDVEAGESSTAASSPLTGGYREPSGCFAFDPAEDWELVEETSLRAAFSTDSENPLAREPEPGEAGIWVEAACTPLDQVGTMWSPTLPGVTTLENRRVEFGGGSGRRIVTLFHLRRLPETLKIQYVVDRRAARCVLRVDGGRDAVERFRPEFDRAAASFVCAGR